MDNQSNPQIKIRIAIYTRSTVEKFDCSTCLHLNDEVVNEAN